MKFVLVLVLWLASHALAVRTFTATPATLTAAEGKLTIVSRDFNAVKFQLSGTWSATLTFEGTLDNSTWVAIPAWNQNSAAASTTTTSNGLYSVSGSGLIAVRARISAYTSGSVVVGAMATEGGLTENTGAGGGGGGDASAANQVTGNASLANIEASAAVMDDWDEADRAKVNPIVGQAGVAGDTGSSGATTQRFVMATDQPTPTNPFRVHPVLTSEGTWAPIAQADTSRPIGISTATTTEIIPLTAGKMILVCHWHVMADGTGTFRWVYGTGTNCGTGTTDIEGSNGLPFVANAGIVAGAGLGPVIVVPAGNALCAVTSAAVNVTGSVSYSKR